MPIVTKKPCAFFCIPSLVLFLSRHKALLHVVTFNNHLIEECYLLGWHTQAHGFFGPPPGPKVPNRLTHRAVSFPSDPYTLLRCTFLPWKCKQKTHTSCDVTVYQQGFSLPISKDCSVFISSWTARPWRRRYYDHLKHQELLTSMAPCNITGMNLQQHHYDNLNSHKLYKHIHPICQHISATLYGIQSQKAGTSKSPVELPLISKALIS
jgi:hypothetical protein